jgi:hypothetical protein
MTAVGEVQVKSTWVTRRAPLDDVIWEPVQRPTVGDLLLCEVISIGIHGRVETATGARQKLYPGDRIVCSLGNRYATSLLEAVADVSRDEIDLISASGLCGRVVSRAKKATNPTRLRVLGQAFVGGAPLNLRTCALTTTAGGICEPKWVVVVGSTMDSGKTTACASIVHGLVTAGHRVGTGKVTGTASARDVGSMRDAGADPFVDFLDFGWPSTAGCSEPELVQVLRSIADTIRASGVDWGVLEIADGLLQLDTRFLLTALPAELGAEIRLVLTVRESLSAVAGVQLLRDCALDVAAVSGIITNSPLLCSEVELATPVSCVPTSQLGDYLARTDPLSPPVAALSADGGAGRA